MCISFQFFHFRRCCTMSDTGGMGWINNLQHFLGVRLGFTDLVNGFLYCEKQSFKAASVPNNPAKIFEG